MSQKLFPPPYQKSYSPALEQLRGIACLLVFLDHTEGVGFLGVSGVALFLALSGFLFRIIYPTDSTILWKQFMAQRAFRILPVFLLIWFLLQSVTPMNSGDLFASLIMQTNLIPRGPSSEFGPIWTLGIEFTFYMLLPFLLPVTARSGVRSSLGILALLVFFNIILTFGPKITTWRPTYLAFTGMYLFSGFCAGHLSLKVKPLVEDSDHIKRLFYTLGMIVLIALLFYIIYLLKPYAPKYKMIGSGGYYIWPSTIMAPVIVMVMYKLHSIPSLIGLLFERLGRISYSFYLFHHIILKFLHEFLHSSIYTTVLTFVISVLVSTVSYVCIEKPFIQYGHELRRRSNNS